MLRKWGLVVLSTALSVLIIIAVWNLIIVRNYRNHLNAPTQQLDTAWKSEDGNICFSIGDEYDGYVEGILMHDQKPMDIVLLFAGSQSMVYIYDKSSVYYETVPTTGQELTRYGVTLAKGSFDMIGKNKCVVRIKEQNSTLDVDFGKKIVLIKEQD